MIEEQFVSFDTARMLKEAGFDVPTSTHYSNSGSVWESPTPVDYNDDKSCKACSRPTQALAARWLREVYDIHVFTNYFFEDGKWFFVIVNLKESDETRAIYPDLGDYQTCDEAFEAGLKRVLKLIKK